MRSEDSRAFDHPHHRSNEAFVDQEEERHQQVQQPSLSQDPAPFRFGLGTSVKVLKFAKKMTKKTAESSAKGLARMASTLNNPLSNPLMEEEAKEDGKPRKLHGVDKHGLDLVLIHIWTYLPAVLDWLSILFDYIHVLAGKKEREKEKFRRLTIDRQT